MIIDTMMKPINFMKIVRECEGGVFEMEIRYYLVNNRWDLKKKWVVDELEETIERELVTFSLEKNVKENEGKFIPYVS